MAESQVDNFSALLSRKSPGFGGMRTDCTD
jgi:hypothetical protein